MSYDNKLMKKNDVCQGKNQPFGEKKAAIALERQFSSTAAWRREETFV